MLKQRNWFILLLLSTFIVGLVVVSVDAEGPVETNKYEVVYQAPNANVLSYEARRAIEFALKNWSKTPPENNTFYVASIRWEETWAAITIMYDQIHTSATNETYVEIDIDKMVSAVLVLTENGWQAAIETDNNERVHELLSYIPDNELSQKIKDVIFPRNNHQLRQSYNNYKLPWPSNFAWWRTQGWHDSWQRISFAFYIKIQTTVSTK
jgi:hypothetical protein